MLDKTGCLITVDGSDDNLIKPEGLPEYQVPPPAMIEPMSSEGPSNIDILSETAEATEMQGSDEQVVLNDEDDFFAPHEEDGQGNIFDIIDSISF